MNLLQLLYIRVQQLKASFVHAQNIAAVGNHCHPWQLWSNSLNYSAGIFNKVSGTITFLLCEILDKISHIFSSRWVNASDE